MNTNLLAFSAEAIVGLVDVGTLARDVGVKELTRRIDKRAAAGKHPMKFVIEARDQLAASGKKLALVGKKAAVKPSPAKANAKARKAA